MVMEGKRRMARYDETSEIRKGPWKAEEDEVLVNHVRKHGPRDWSSIRSKGLLQRTGKSCRLRWVNKLRPSLKSGVKFSAEEERTVIELQAQFGNKWAKIATHLTGRTDNDVKNFWSSRQKRLARILQTSASSSSKPQKNNSKEVTGLRHVPLEVPNFSSSTEEASLAKTKSCCSSHIDINNSHTIQMAMNQSILSYEQSPHQFNFIPENRPFIDPQMQRDFPLQLESQDFINRLGGPTFFDVFECSSESALGPAPLPIEASCFGPDSYSKIVGKAEGPDIFVDDFPSIDMFDPIEPLPSPSDWSSMD